MCGDDITYQPPTTIDYGDSMAEGLAAQVRLAPDLYKAEADPDTGRAAYARLSQEVTNIALLGKKELVDSEGFIEKQTQNRQNPERTLLANREEAYDHIIEKHGLQQLIRGWDNEAAGDHAMWTKYLTNPDGSYDKFAIVDKWRSLHGGNTDDPNKIIGMEVNPSTNKPVEVKYETERVNVGKEKAGTRVHAGGGAVANIGGDKVQQFTNADGSVSNRKAGFDSAGNFEGISALARDLQQLDTAQRFQTELKLIEQNGNEFTDAYRKQGDIKTALEDVKTLTRDRSAIPEQSLDAGGNALSDMAASFGEGSRIKSPFEQAQPQQSNLNSGIMGAVKPSPVNQRDSNLPVDQTLSQTRDLPQANALPQGFKESVRRRGNLYIKTITSPDGTENTFSAQTMEDLNKKAYAWANDSIAVRNNNQQTYEKELGISEENVQPESGTLTQSSNGNNLAPNVGKINENQSLGNMMGMRDTLMTQAQSDLLLGGDLSDRDLRNSQQQARAASVARGRSRDASGIISELQNNEAAQDRRRNMRRTFAGQVMQNEGQLRTQENAMGLQAAMTNQQTQMGLTQMDQAAQAGNQAAEMQRQKMLLGATESDINRGIQVEQINKQFEQSGLAMDRAAVAQRVGLEQATAADPLAAITGRPSGAGVMNSQNLYGNAAGGVQAPSMYNPTAGAQFASNQAAGLNSYNAAYMGAQAQVSAGKSAMFGNIIGGGLTGLGAGIGCWVAREVYGDTNYRWVLFRQWLFSDSPSWFKRIYLKFGERFAEFISDKPKLKSVIKKWMDSKIKEGK